MRLSATRLTSICGIGRKAWTPRLLFAPGDLGAWYDPSDLLTLFQDSLGTTPVTTAGNPIGLELDKRYDLALGANIVTNGGFDTDTAWSKGANWVIAGGVASNSAAAGSNLTQTVLQVGKFYRVGFDLVAALSNTLNVFVGASTVVPFVNTTAIGRKYINARCAGDGRLIFQSNGAGTTIDNVTAQELFGSHAIQPTATARPAYRANPSRVDYDGTDDSLVTTFPSALGSNCTIVRAQPGVGTSILTGQTIGTTYSDNQDHCGLLIINRVLTPIETARITNYFNAKSF